MRESIFRLLCNAIKYCSDNLLLRWWARVILKFALQNGIIVPPRVSICLPTYNGEKYLTEAIESIIAQTETDWELLICDDLSADGSLEIAESFAQKDWRIKASCNSTRLGLFPNYNHCMQIATGEFIKLFAQDDRLMPSALSGALDAFSDSTVALSTGAKHWIDEHGEVVETIRQFAEDTTMIADEVIFDNLMKFTNWVGEPSCVMFPRKFVGAGFDTALYHSGDIEMWFRVLQNGRLHYSSNVQCCFRRHSSSESSYNLKSLRFALDFLRLGESYIALLESKGVSKRQYVSEAVRSAARVVFSLVDDEDVESADTGRISGMTEAASKADLARMTELCFEALFQLVMEAERANAIRTDLQTELRQAEERLATVVDSLSWRVTKPIREAKRRLSR